MMHYSAHQIESKWRKWWEQKKLYRTPDHVPGNQNFYHLVMFPYTSGDAHMGHWYNYGPADIWARWKRRQGPKTGVGSGKCTWNVLSPIGFDAFGLPAENAAIKGELHPRDWTMQNIARMREQLKSIGTIYDWAREVVTSDPAYYRWNQWLFLQLYKAGLAYRAPVAANWCPKCKTVLANEQVVDGACERCDTPVVQKHVTQWLFKITAYADQLLDDLEALDWPEKTKAMQRNWIGRSEGAIMRFKIKKQKSKNKNTNQKLKISTAEGDDHGEFIEVFTTRADTLYGATYLVLAPEHPFVAKVTTPVKRKAVARYLAATKRKTERERMAEVKRKTGVFTGGYAVNPANGATIPIWISDYVLMGYGTGAIMAVPAHDERDFAFAKAMKLPIVEVVSPDAKPHRRLTKPYTADGILVRSGLFSEKSSADGRRLIVAELEKQGLAKPMVQYRLRDWIISRQRYWGTPIPIMYCRTCWEIQNPKSKIQKKSETQNSKMRVGIDYAVFEGKEYIIHLMPEKDLPVVLPDVRDFKPTGTGQSPLARSKEFVSTKCPKCGGPAKRETDTMDTFVDSSWYYLRYTDPANTKVFADPKKIAAWLPVGMYIGGAEHSVLHLLYSRFCTKALFDMGYVKFTEPFLSLRHQGVVLGEDHYKMSKSRGNVISPDELVARYGTDVVRLYLAFMGDWSKGGPWSSAGIAGMARFVNRIWSFFAEVKLDAGASSPELRRAMHAAIKQVGTDVERFEFNTAVSGLMVFFSKLAGEPSREAARSFVSLLAPFAPHLSEELWQGVLKEQGSVHDAPWPRFDERALVQTTAVIVVQVDGKVRDRLELPARATEQEALTAAFASQRVRRFITPETLARSVYIPKRLLNLVRKKV